MMKIHCGLHQAFSMMRQRASLLALANEMACCAAMDVGLPLTGFSERLCEGALILEFEVQLAHIMRTLGGHLAKSASSPSQR